MCMLLWNVSLQNSVWVLFFIKYFGLIYCYNLNRHILPGTIIVLDGWRVYNNINQIGSEIYQLKSSPTSKTSLILKIIWFISKMLRICGYNVKGNFVTNLVLQKIYFLHTCMNLFGETHSETRTISMPYLNASDSNKF